MIAPGLIALSRHAADDAVSEFLFFQKYQFDMK
jgi:hypothetical protein